MNAASPSLRLIEFTMLLPCTHLSPASRTPQRDESTTKGIRLTDGSEPSRLRNVVMASTESSSPSSMLMSSICAPLSTCCRATSTAAS